MKKSGFTLLQLLAVIAVMVFIGLLLGTLTRLLNHNYTEGQLAGQKEALGRPATLESLPQGSVLWVVGAMCTADGYYAVVQDTLGGKLSSQSKVYHITNALSLVEGEWYVVDQEYVYPPDEKGHCEGMKVLKQLTANKAGADEPDDDGPMLDIPAPGTREELE